MELIQWYWVILFVMTFLIMIALLVLLFCYLRRQRMAASATSAHSEQRYPSLCSRHQQQNSRLLYVHRPASQGLTENLYWQHYNPRDSLRGACDMEDPVPAYTEHIPEWDSVYNPTTVSLNDYPTEDTAKLVV